MGGDHENGHEPTQGIDETRQLDPETRANPDDRTTPLERKEDEPPSRFAALNVEEGTRIGRYVLGSKLGEGGMGSVYVAEQTEPVQRRVAIKIIQIGMDTGELLRRFEAEQQILALLEHPNIATMLDAGATPKGRPYFVMEYVDGVEIDQYCARERLTIRERVGLFLQVLSGIEHAHQKGIIHRDIKPGNIVVAQESNRPVAKIIDFGIAKPLADSVAGDGLRTAHGQVIGTPRYMAPEQARLSSDSLDVRTDIFSLGVVLFELLVGVSPFERKSPGIDDHQYVTSRESMSPVQGLTRTPVVDQLAKERGATTKSLRRILAGDIASVVLKALSNERSARYRSVSEFADDLNRYLTGYPVIAKPRRFWYLAARFAARRKALIASTAVLVLMLIATAIIAVVGFLRAEEAALEANLIAEFQSKQLSEIDAANMGSDLRRELLAEVRTALERGGLDAAAIDKDMAELESRIAGANFTNLALTVLDENIFDRAIAVIDEEFAGRPLVQARLWQTVANTLRSLGRLDQAQIPQQRALETRQRVLGEDHPDSIQSAIERVRLLLDQGRLEEAEKEAPAVLAVARQFLGHEHPQTLLALNHLGSLYSEQSKLEEAATTYQEALDLHRKVLGNEHPDTIAAVMNVGALLSDRGKLQEAMPYYQEALDTARRALGNEHPHTMAVINNMGYLLQSQGKLTEAEPFFREALDTRRRVLGDEHPSTITSIGNMGGILDRQGMLAEAEPYYQEAMDTSRRVLGDVHPQTLMTIHNMGFILKIQGKLEAAEPYYREALETSRQVLGNEHVDTLISISTYAGLLDAQGKLDEARAYYQESLDTRRRVLGDDHPLTLSAINNMGTFYSDLGDLEQAERYYLESLEAHRRVLGDDHPDTLIAINNMGLHYVEKGDFDQAERYYTESLASHRRVLGDEHYETLTAINNMGTFLARQDRYEEAMPYFRENLETSQRVLGNDHSHTLRAMHNMGGFLRDRGQLDEANTIGGEAVQAARDALGPDHPWVGVFLSSHGRTLAEMKRWQDAEKALLESHQLLSKSGDGRERFLPRPLRALVGLYEAWHSDQPDGGYDLEASKWQVRLDAVESR